MKRKMIMRKKFCRFCVERMGIDYKDGKFLQTFVNERFKILPRRITGVCAKHQHVLTEAIKRARILAFIPFTATQVREMKS